MPTERRREIFQKQKILSLPLRSRQLLSKRSPLSNISSQRIGWKVYSREKGSILSSENSRVLNSSDSGISHHFQSIIMLVMLNLIQHLQVIAEILKQVQDDQNNQIQDDEARTIRSTMLISSPILTVPGSDMRLLSSVMSTSSSRKKNEFLSRKRWMRQGSTRPKYLTTKGRITSISKHQKNERIRSISNV